MTDRTRAPGQTMEIRELGYLLSRGRTWILAGGLLGLLAGAAVLWLVAPRYEGRGTVLLRNPVQNGPSGLSEISELLVSLPINLGGSAVETETAILTSRTVVGEVVDSLGLQVEVVAPAGLAPLALFDHVRAAARARDAEYTFERRGDVYHVRGAGDPVPILPGAAVAVPGVELVLSAGALPERFTIRVRDRQSAIKDVEDGLRNSVAGGEVVELVYRSRSAELSAAVPNALIGRYLERRRTTDRGVNQYRYEFLRDHVDSITVQLAAAEDALRRHQEASGVLVPELAAETGVRRVSELRAELERGQVESRTLRGILAKADEGTLTARELAAYPSFIGNPAINGLLSRLLDLETQRIVLLERRPANDPEVVPLTESIQHLEARLVAISRDHLAGLLRREAEIAADLARHQGDLHRLPAESEVAHRLVREVRRLSETQVALQTQLVAAQLAAISEGGEVRQVDMAVAPDEPIFPTPVQSLAGGILAGLFFGTVGAVGVGRLRRRICTPVEAELATGIPTFLFGPQVPLSFPELGRSRTLLLIPADSADGVVPVAERIAATAALQGREAVLADMSQSRAVISPSRFAEHIPVGRIVTEGVALQRSESGPVDYPVYQALGNGHPDRRSTLASLEQRSSLVVAALPHALDASTVSVLERDRPVVIVARAGVSQNKLQEAIAACTRMGANVLAIVLQPPARPG